MSSDIEATVFELDARAAYILPRMQASGRPFFIEFAGTPKSGKTTIAQNLSLFLRRNGFKCATIVERASVAPFGSKRDMRFNIWTACQTLTSMLEYLDSDASVVLIDRGLFDALCWTEMLQMIGEVEEQERMIVQRFLMVERWRSMLDLVFLVTTTPELALRHEFKNAFTLKPGSIMNDETIGILNAAGARVCERVEPCFRICRLDMSEQTVLGGVEEVIRQTLSIFDEKLRRNPDEAPVRTLVEV